jgi:hypothetical protein
MLECTTFMLPLTLLLLTDPADALSRRRLTDADLCEYDLVVIGTVTSKSQGEAVGPSDSRPRRFVSYGAAVERVLSGSNYPELSFLYDAHYDPELVVGGKYVLFLSGPSGRDGAFRYSEHRFIDWGTVVPDQRTVRQAWLDACSGVSITPASKDGLESFFTSIRADRKAPTDVDECVP